MNYAEDIRIDETQLEVELADLPGLSYEYGRKELEAKEAYDSAKKRMKVKYAQLSSEARNNPDLVPGGKATDKAIECYVEAHEEYIELGEELLELEHEYDLIKLAASEIRFTKSKSLDLLVQLLNRGYFEGPSKPRTNNQFSATLAEKRRTREKAGNAVGRVMRKRRE